MRATRRRLAKRPRRRAALELLAGAGSAGCDAAALLQLGFDVPDLFALVRDGLAAPRAVRLSDNSRSYDLSRIWITAAGRAVLEKALASPG